MNPEQLIDDLNDILLGEYFKFNSILGKGSFGIVISAYSSSLDKQVAIKIASYYEQQTESELLFECSHPNIVKLYKVLIANNYIYLIMEQLTGNTLDKILKESIFQIDQIRNIMLQVLQALTFLHKKGIIHRDLKPENIFIQNNNIVKLIDLGLGYQIICRGIIGQQVGTPYYIAPEIINNQEQTQAIDIFSLGIIFYQMLCKNQHPLWLNGYTKKDYYKIISQEFTIQFPNHISLMAQDFLNNTITYNPLDRMTAEQCLQHPWILSEESKSHPITNKEIKLRYTFSQKFQLLIKALQLLQYIKENSHQQLHYQKTFESDEILLDDDIPKTTRIHTETLISVRSHRKYYKPLKAVKSHQHIPTVKIQQTKYTKTSNQLNIAEKYLKSIDLQLPKVTSQKKYRIQLPSISPYTTRQSSFNFRQL